MSNNSRRNQSKSWPGRREIGEEQSLLMKEDESVGDASRESEDKKSVVELRKAAENAATLNSPGKTLKLPEPPWRNPLEAPQLIESPGRHPELAELEEPDISEDIHLSLEHTLPSEASRGVRFAMGGHEVEGLQDFLACSELQQKGNRELHHSQNENSPTDYAIAKQWCLEKGCHSMADIVEFEKVEEFVSLFGLKEIPRIKMISSTCKWMVDRKTRIDATLTSNKSWSDMGIRGLVKTPWPEETPPPCLQRPFKVMTKVNLHHLISVDDDKEHFKLIFDLVLHWEDPWFRGIESTVHFMNKRKLKGLYRRDYDPETKMVTCHIMKSRSNTSKSHCQEECGDLGRSALEKGVAYEFPETEVHHVETPGLESLDEASWCPKFTMSVLTSPAEVLKQNPLELQDAMTGRVKLYTKYMAEFTHPLDMREFPFDSHRLEFTVNPTVPKTEMVFEQFRNKEDNHCRIKMARGSAWDIDYEKQVQEGTARFRDLPKGEWGPREDYSQLVCQLFIKRRPQFYVHNYVFALFLMTLLSFGAFAVPITDVAGRGSITVTMCLTVVSLKLLMSTQLPRKPYVTHMEKYVISSFMLVCVPMLRQAFYLQVYCGKKDNSDIVDHTSSRKFKLISDGYDCDDEWIMKADRLLMILFVVAWVMMHVACGLLWSCKRRFLVYCVRHHLHLVILLAPFVLYAPINWWLEKNLDASDSVPSSSSSEDTSFFSRPLALTFSIIGCLALCIIYMRGRRYQSEAMKTPD